TTSATVPGKRKRRRRFRRSRCRLEKPSVLRRRVSFVVLRKRLPRNESLRLIPCRASCRSAHLGQDRPAGAASYHAPAGAQPLLQILGDQRIDTTAPEDAVR